MECDEKRSNNAWARICAPWNCDDGLSGWRYADSYAWIVDRAICQCCSENRWVNSLELVMYNRNVSLTISFALQFIHFDAFHWNTGAFSAHIFCCYKLMIEFDFWFVLRSVHHREMFAERVAGSLPEIFSLYVPKMRWIECYVFRKYIYTLGVFSMRIDKVCSFLQ